MAGIFKAETGDLTSDFLDLPRNPKANKGANIDCSSILSESAALYRTVQCLLETATCYREIGFGSLSSQSFNYNMMKA